MIQTASSPNLLVERTSSGLLQVQLSGNWRGQSKLPSVETIRQSLSEGLAVSSLEFNVTHLTGWDSRFVAFIVRCASLCRDRHMDFRGDGLPEGVRRLLRLANAVPEKRDARSTASKPGFIQNLGEHAVKGWEGALGLLAFLGENVLALGNLLRGRAQFRWADALLVMEQCGPSRWKCWLPNRSSVSDARTIPSITTSSTASSPRSAPNPASRWNVTVPVR